MVVVLEKKYLYVVEEFRSLKWFMQWNKVDHN